MDEDSWRAIFEDEIEQRGIGDVWHFCIDENFGDQKGWLEYCVSSFARFDCSVCGRYWSSSKVHIQFHVRLHKRYGQVKMHIYKQKCKMCFAAKYETPVFMEDNMEVAISRVVDWISKKFYSLSAPKVPRDFVKDGRQDGPHDFNNCEACSKGVCRYAIDWESSNKKTVHPVSKNLGNKELYGLSLSVYGSNPPTYTQPINTSTSLQKVVQPAQSSYRPTQSGARLSSSSCHTVQMSQHQPKKSESSSDSWCVIL